MAKSKKPKPSFEPSDEPPGAAASWVYRSDATPAAAPAAPVEPAAPKATAPRIPARTATNPVNRRQDAQRLVDRYAKYAAGAGLVPVPLVDVAAIGAVQLKMLGALARHYDVPFDPERGKAILAALTGSVMSSLAGYQVLKLFGPLAGILGVSGFASAATYGVGRIFIAHFESGGTLLDVDVETSRRQLASNLNRP